MRRVETHILFSTTVLLHAASFAVFCGGGLSFEDVSFVEFVRLNYDSGLRLRQKNELGKI